MLKKWFHKLLFITLLSWGTFTISNYLLQEILVNHRTNLISFELISELDQQLAFSYNTLPTQIGTEVHQRSIAGSTQRQRISIPFPHDKVLHRIYITSKSENVTFNLKSISFLGYKSISWNASELTSLLKNGNENGMISDQHAKEDGGIQVHLDKRFPILYITETLAGRVYDELFHGLQTYARILAGLCWILLLLAVSFSSYQWTSPSFAMNFCTLFLVFIFTPFFSQKEHETTENRTLAPFPDLSVNVWKLPKSYTAYFNDHFPFRNELTRLDNFIKYKLFHISTKPDFVLVGKENWLYCSVNQVRKAYQDAGFTVKELETIKNKLESKAAMLQKENIDFYVMVPPLKHSVYPEYLPAALKKRKGDNKRAQLMKYLKTNSTINLIDPYPLLVSLKDSIRVYYKSDTHWNQVSAFRVYQQMITKMSVNHPELKPMELAQFDIERKLQYDGDLTGFINLKKEFYREPFLLTPKFNLKSSGANVGPVLGSEQSYLYYQAEADSSNQLRLLMYRDSFGEYLRRHLAENFHYTGFSWDRQLNPERIKQADPDIVVYELMERFIDYLLTEKEQPKSAI